MAGDRQHILPRFLLKGFASRIEGGKIYTWIYPRNSPPVEANIRKVAVEKHFYGKRGELSVDDDITKLEGQYAPLLEELRTKQLTYEISDPRIANFITHLSIRTKHIRDSLLESSEFIFEKISKYLSDFANFKAAMLSQPGIKEFKKSLMDIQASRSVRRKSQKLAKRILPGIIDAKQNEMQLFYQNMFETVKNSLPIMIKDGHIKGLSKGLTPEPRVGDYIRLKWFVYDCAESLILGDMGCLFETMENNFKFLTFKGDEVKNIFLPISDKRILIGTCLSETPHVDLNIINNAIAKCSREFFICSKYSPDICSLVSLLGSETEIISKEELGAIAKGIFLKYGAS